MSEKIIPVEDHVAPARLTDNDTGIVYELDFSRDSVRFAEQRGFELENAVKFPVTGLSDLFYYAFRKNHKSVPREKTDKLLEKWGGLPLLSVHRYDLGPVLAWRCMDGKGIPPGGQAAAAEGEQRGVAAGIVCL